MDFINHLRAATVGWRIEPVLLLKPITTNNQIIDVVKPPAGISFTNFFTNYTPKADKIDDCNSECLCMTKADTFQAIRIKIKNHLLTYFIQCNIVIDRKPMLELSYWRGTGWLQTKRSIRWQRYKYEHECSKDKISYRVYKIDRIKKGTKRRGIKRPGTPNIIYCDRIDLSDPNATYFIADKTIWTLTRAMTVIPGNNNYSHHDHVYVYTTNMGDKPDHSDIKAFTIFKYRQ